MNEPRRRVFAGCHLLQLAAQIAHHRVVREARALEEVVADLPAPIIVGPPCAASPPTTAVVSRDGGHWLVVGGQVARDGAGNVVGKGDMPAQIEQVGKNVDACLKAGGATVNAIISTVTHVTAPAEFDKYADLLPRYFGQPSPESTVVPTPQLSSPDFLLESRGLRGDQVSTGNRADSLQIRKHPAQKLGAEVQQDADPCIPRLSR